MHSFAHNYASQNERFLVALYYNDPDPIAFSVLTNEQTFFLKSFGQAFCCSFRFSDCFAQHLLCRVGIILEKVQRLFLQSAIVALWNGTLGGFVFSPEDVAETILKLIFTLEYQVFKESFQIDRCRGNSESIVVVVRPDQSVPEIPGVFLERLVADLEAELAEVKNREDGCRPGIPFHERMNLPKSGDELADVLDRFLRSIRDYIKGFSMASSLMQGNTGLRTSRRRNGYWTARASSMPLHSF